MKVKELLDRYNLKTRQSLYDRLNGLNLTLSKNEVGHNFATPEQIELLDQLNEHIKNGGAIATFTPLSTVSIDSVEDTQLDTVPQTLDIQTDTLAQLAMMLSHVIQSDPLAYHSSLERAAVSGWELKTSEVKQLVGTKPTGKVWIRGCWVFSKIRCGDGKFKRIGAETAWKVKKAVGGD